MAGGDEEPEVEDEVQRTSFSDAGNALIDEEDDERMDAMGDFDTNPAVSTNRYSRDTQVAVLAKQRSPCCSSFEGSVGDFLGSYTPC